MKKRSAPIVLVAGLLGLAACGGTHDEATPEPEVAESIAEPLHDAVEKAEAVEDQVMQHKKAIDEALEVAEEEAASDGE